MRSKVSSDWLPSYITTTLPVLDYIQNGWILSGQLSFLPSILASELTRIARQSQQSRNEKGF